MMTATTRVLCSVLSSIPEGSPRGRMVNFSSTDFVGPPWLRAPTPATTPAGARTQMPWSSRTARTRATACSAASGTGRSRRGRPEARATSAPWCQVCQDRLDLSSAAQPEGCRYRRCAVCPPAPPQPLCTWVWCSRKWGGVVVDRARIAMQRDSLHDPTDSQTCSSLQ